MKRAAFGEILGSAFLLYVIVGSGIAAQGLTNDPGLQLFTHAVAVGVGLGALIAMLQSVSGSHFNPAVTLAFWRTKLIDGVTATNFILAQLAGAIIGVSAAHVSFQQSLFSMSSTKRNGPGFILSEGVATFVLVLLILALVRTDRSKAIPAAVGAWVACVVFATVSTGFTNPAVTIARMLTNTYTGVAPASVPGFLFAQVIGSLLAAATAHVLYPNVQTNLPHQ